MSDEIIKVNIGKVFLEDLVANLERVIILLEDNPKMKDVAGFYSGESLIGDIVYFHKEIKGVLKDG